MKRRLFKLVLFRISTVAYLVIGCTINIAVSIAFAFWTNEVSRTKALTPPHVSRVWTNYRDPTWPLVPSVNVKSRQLESWGITIVDLSSTDNPHLVNRPVWRISQTSAGWPARSFKAGMSTMNINPLPIHTGGVLLPRSNLRIRQSLDKELEPFQVYEGVLQPLSTPQYRMPKIDDLRVNSLSYKYRLIPYSPIWLGIVINTLFYAAACRLLAACCRKIRRMIRLERGRCPICAYSLCGDKSRARYLLKRGCPECGWGRDAEA